MILGHVLLFFCPNLIFLIEALSKGFAATLWLYGTAMTKSSDVHVNGSGWFCKPLLIKSSTAKRTPLMWLHFPFLCNPRPAGQVQVARKISQEDENSTTTLFLYQIFPFGFGKGRK